MYAYTQNNPIMNVDPSGFYNVSTVSRYGGGVNNNCIVGDNYEYCMYFEDKQYKKLEEFGNFFTEEEGSIGYVESNVRGQYNKKLKYGLFGKTSVVNSVQKKGFDNGKFGIYEKTVADLGTANGYLGLLEAGGEVSALSGRKTIALKVYDWEFEMGISI